jgi:ATP-dependent DNA helicase MPH1
VTSYRQTTLFGQAVIRSEGDQPAQSNRNRAFRADLPPEPPTHHELDREALRTWIYPTNLGPTRDYQFSIVKNGLFNNTLVALPTGLGKTFIAATIMLNYYRWTKKAKLIFMAPTKPLVAQQVGACFTIVEIPRSDTTLLTGEVSPAMRADEWETKRVFFVTPQTLENDLSLGLVDPKSISLLVIDEAHRATGNYSYVKVVNFIRRFSNSFRILALTATPGAKVEAVQEVMDSLGVSHVEIRTEESIDIRQYVHQREEDIILLDPSEEMVLVKDLFSQALKPLVDKLSQQNIYYGRDPMSLTVYGLMKAKKDWFGRAGQHANQGIKFMMMTIFSVLQSLAHSIKLLNFHGIKPFYDNMVQFRDDIEGKGEKGSKYKRQIVGSSSFQEMMSKINRWSSQDNFIGHPKLTYLSDTVLNHFLDAGDGREGASSSSTRIIVFSEYRDSAEEIVRVLNTHTPLVRAAVFVGQADSKRSEGMKQSEQIERIKRFKDGDFNVLVATSIGEEGLDIGQVDLIVCYDASASPIRMLQRMGRTGRKRAGRVVLLLMRGKEEEKYSESKDAYEKMQSMICDGSRFNFRHDLSTRIVPRDIVPEVDLRAVEIPIENTQNQSMPEPRKGKPRKKKPAKKFHMPDGVETGFTTVASMLGKPKVAVQGTPSCQSGEELDAVHVPALSHVLLNRAQTDELNRSYKNLPYYKDGTEEIELVDLTAHPQAQRTLRKTASLKHGDYTKRCVKLFRTLARSQSTSERYKKPYGDSDNSQFHQLPSRQDPAEVGDEASRKTSIRGKRRSSLSLSEEDERQPTQYVSHTTSRKSTAARKQQKTSISSTKRRSLASEKQKETTASGPRRRGRPKKVSRSTGMYDESADEGDDCRRTSDLDLSDDSDNGSDLVDFIVGDDVATSSALLTSSMQRRSSPPAPSATSFVTMEKHRTFHHSLPSSSSQRSFDNDDELPSMSQLVQRSRESAAQAAAGSDEDQDDEDNVSISPITTGRRAKRRRIVLDDDDDDDDDEEDDDDGDEYS